MFFLDKTFYRFYKRKEPYTAGWWGTVIVFSIFRYLTLFSLIYTIGILFYGFKFIPEIVALSSFVCCFLSMANRYRGEQWRAGLRGKRFNKNELSRKDCFIASIRLILSGFVAATSTTALVIDFVCVPYELKGCIYRWITGG